MASGLTFPQIIQRGGKLRAVNAQFVRLTKYKAGYTPDGYAFAACQSYSTHYVAPNGRRMVNQARHRYVTVVKFLDTKLHCVVSCSCDDFKYTFETVLFEKGAAELEYSNGEAPDIRNPLHRVGVCKHLVALYRKIEPQIKVKHK